MFLAGAKLFIRYAYGFWRYAIINAHGPISKLFIQSPGVMKCLWRDITGYIDKYRHE